MTRKEQKEERKQKILMTALTLFVERGYYDTKITDIAEAVPMSTGLMFHYFESKEELLLELVKMGAAGTKSANSKGGADVPPEIYLEKFLEQLFSYAKEQPWVFNMFVLMGQVRRNGMPEEARKVAMAVNSIDFTAALIARGQMDGILKMVEEDRYCIDISTQLMATEAILNKVNKEILTAHLKHCLAHGYRYKGRASRIRYIRYWPVQSLWFPVCASYRPTWSRAVAAFRHCSYRGSGYRDRVPLDSRPGSAQRELRWHHYRLTADGWGIVPSHKPL